MNMICDNLMKKYDLCIINVHCVKYSLTCKPGKFYVPKDFWSAPINTVFILLQPYEVHLLIIIILPTQLLVLFIDLINNTI